MDRQVTSARYLHKWPVLVELEGLARSAAR